LRATGGAEAAKVDRLFLQALQEIGHEDGRTIRLVEYSGQNGVERMPGLAATEPPFPRSTGWLAHTVRSF
jgi:hypothetical protein